jgi:hypothetical protein
MNGNRGTIRKYYNKYLVEERVRNFMKNNEEFNALHLKRTPKDPFGMDNKPL